jgi:hypothetical protein
MLMKWWASHVAHRHPPAHRPGLCRRFPQRIWPGTRHAQARYPTRHETRFLPTEPTEPRVRRQYSYETFPRKTRYGRDTPIPGSSRIDEWVKFGRLLRRKVGSFGHVSRGRFGGSSAELNHGDPRFGATLGGRP